MQGTTFWKRGCRKVKNNEGLRSSWILCGIRWQRNIPWRKKAFTKLRKNPSASHCKKKFWTEWYKVREISIYNIDLLKIGIISRDFSSHDSGEPPVGLGVLKSEVPRSYSDTSYSVELLYTGDQLVAEISTWMHTQQLQETSMPPAGFETHNLSRRAARDPRLRSRGHWDRAKQRH
jgi:hypothetical protein